MIYGSVLGAILAAVANITLAVHMMIVKVNKPAVVVAVFKVILELVVFDILPMDDFYDWLEFQKDELPNLDLAAAGYETDSSIMNMGSVSVFFWCSIYGVFILWFLNRVVPDGKEKQTLNAWRESFNYNQVINLLWANITMIFCCIFVQARYTKNN